MKARYKTYSESDLEKMVKEKSLSLLEEYKDQLYDAVKEDVFDQALAICFIALEQLGWKKKRLTRFKNMIDDVTNLIYTGFMGRDVTTRDAQQHLKESYGIDFSKSRYNYED